MPVIGDRQLTSRRTLARPCAWLFLLFFTATAPAADKPQRIVSINVCTDQLLLTLVERERIVSLSHLTADPYSSWVGSEADGLYSNRGTAEEVIALDPDLVLAAPFGFRPTVTILERLGYSVVELPMATSLDDIAANLRALADAVGERERANAVIAKFDAEIEHQTYRDIGPRPLFVSYEADGWMTGSDSLVADVARTAGFEPLGERLGFSGGRRVSLEELLLLEPQLMDLGHPWDEPPALVSETMRHPAMRALLERTTLIEVPDPLWICGSVRTLEALAILRRARDDLGTVQGDLGD